ncbi:MAG: divalent-cation tolerance protein CutA [Planctomycetaceae bacterium]
MREPTPPSASADIVEIRTTFGDRAAAEACAARLVRERLAACVQIDGPVAATYAWRGAVETSTEWRCTVKTTPRRAAACRAALTAGHPYDLPEIVESPATASPAYAAWVRESVDET